MRGQNRRTDTLSVPSIRCRRQLVQIIIAVQITIGIQNHGACDGVTAPDPVAAKVAPTEAA